MPVPPARSDAASTAAPFAAASAVSNHLDTRTAATEVAHAISESLGGPADLVFAFASYHHRAALPVAIPGPRGGRAGAADILRRALLRDEGDHPGALLAVTAESVMGNDVELEGRAGLSVLALRMPGVRLHPFRLLPNDPSVNLNDAASMRALTGASEDTRAIILFADPFSTPVAQLLPLMASCVPGVSIPIGGGLASGSSQPGMNVLVMNEQSQNAGLVGVSISGPVAVDWVVSQGCKPIGKPHVITKAEQNILIELGGRPALEVVRETAESLDEHDRELLGKGLFFGLVIDEYKSRFGRGDFLIRNVLGIDQNRGAIAVGELLKVGRTVQMHVRDAATAAEDLQLLLDAQQLKDAPAGVLAFTCNGRGTRLFPEPHHDAATLRDRLGHAPLAGFFAGGEIGPIGGRSFLHGHTLSAAVFRRSEGQ